MWMWMIVSVGLTLSDATCLLWWLVVLFLLSTERDNLSFSNTAKKKNKSERQEKVRIAELKRKTHKVFKTLCDAMRGMAKHETNKYTALLLCAPRTKNGWDSYDYVYVVKVWHSIVHIMNFNKKKQANISIWCQFGLDLLTFIQYKSRV